MLDTRRQKALLCQRKPLLCLGYLGTNDAVDMDYGLVSFLSPHASGAGQDQKKEKEEKPEAWMAGGFSKLEPRSFESIAKSECELQNSWPVLRVLKRSV